MTTLWLDIESYSSTDLLKSGVYKYVQAPDFEILMMAYAFDDDPVKIIDLAAGEELPSTVLEALTDPTVRKKAHNANFERTCITQHFGLVLPPEQWECTMAKVAQLGLPLSLDAASKALNLDQEKSSEGKALIKYFCVPCKPTKVNGGRSRNLANHDPAKWEKFQDYCIQDVVVERAIENKISFFSFPETEKKLWCLDQLINDSGVMVDLSFVKNAIRHDITYRDRLFAEAVEITKLDNPNSAAQLKDWLTEQTGEEVTSLTKEAVPKLLEQTSSDTVTRVLEIRQELSKTSVKKYAAMAHAVCSDGRIRGLLQYYGANRTGRWAGRLVQVQNLPTNHLESLDLARNTVKDNDLDLLEVLYGNVPDTLSQLIRTAFIAPKGHRFIIADFAAIEARVIAWLAGEKWRLDVFKTHGMIYEASASQMFKVPLQNITKTSPLRKKGKVAELALGFQGGPNALIKMGALKMGLQEEELPKLVSMWRNANKAIVNLWETVGEAALDAVVDGKPQTINHGIRFSVEDGILFIQLPSKRRLAYFRPKTAPNRFSQTSLSYEGMDQKHWGRQETYGGKLVENIVQATARDVLADAMLRLHDAGYKIAFHVHDEPVLEASIGQGSTTEVNRIMSTPIPWAKGLPLHAESYETDYYYKKD